VESLLREFLLTPQQSPDQDAPTVAEGRVLIVDDDPGVREMFRRSLELAHFDAVVAGGGDEGLRLLRADPAIRLVLLDLTMPGMDGRQFRNIQRADPGLATVPTIIVTGSALGHIVHAELMALDYLLKPVAREHLISVVGRYCRPVVQ
jgi:CheY-like chemotaxis protein